MKTNYFQKTLGSFVLWKVALVGKIYPVGAELIYADRKSLPIEYLSFVFEEIIR